MAGTLLIDRLAAGGEAGELVAERRWRRNRSPDPLAMDADWLARRAKHLRRSGREAALQIDLTGPSRRIQSVIGAAIELSARNRFDSWLVRWPAQFDPDRAEAMDALGRQLYGEQWDFTARWVGHDRLARDFERRFRDFVAGSIVGRSPADRGWVGEGLAAGQFDAVHAQIAATRVVHGIRMRRQEVDELERWLDLARSTGPWWSYEDWSSCANVRSRSVSTTQVALTPRTVRPSHTRTASRSGPGTASRFPTGSSANQGGSTSQASTPR